MPRKKPLGPDGQPLPRLLRTPEECFQAGWDAGANDRPLSRAEIERIAALWRPYYKPSAARTA